MAVALLLIAGGSFVCPANGQAEETGSRKVVSKSLPSYPSIARTMNLTGAVKLEAVVAANGSVKSVQVLGGNPVFAQSAEVAVRGWKWEKSDHDTTEHVEVRFNP
jgi:TonB family protein